MNDKEMRDFRDEIRSFLSDTVPSEMRIARSTQISSSLEEVKWWTRQLYNKGWLVPSWPTEWGGRNWSPMKRYVLQEELATGGCPDTDRIALDLIGPIIYTFGTEDQKNQYLPRIQNAEDFWCQGFSEPDAGSDLNMIRTRAVRNQDHYIVNGRKIWTTAGHLSNMMFALVKVNSGKPAPGLTMMLLDMTSPGVEVRPIPTIENRPGNRHCLNEVFLEDVKVPLSNLIGQEHQGWKYARFLLNNERRVVAGVPFIRRDLQTAEAIARLPTPQSRRLIDDMAFAQRLTTAHVECEALECLVLRMLTMSEDDPELAKLAPIAKLRGGELRQEIGAIMFESLGERAIVNRETNEFHESLDITKNVASSFLFRRAATMAGGTGEIQRNILAAVALEL